MDARDSRFQVICKLQDVPDPGAREFELRLANDSTSGVLVHWRGNWYAYRNSCPHTGVSLNWQPGEFFDICMEFLQCSVHGALFRAHDGYCVRGPCMGQSLRPLPVKIAGSDVGIDLERLKSLE